MTARNINIRQLIKVLRSIEENGAVLVDITVAGEFLLRIKEAGTTEVETKKEEPKQIDINTNLEDLI